MKSAPPAPFDSFEVEPGVPLMLHKTLLRGKANLLGFGDPHLKER